jgi:hypothetical protein
MPAGIVPPSKLSPHVTTDPPASFLVFNLAPHSSPSAVVCVTNAASSAVAFKVKTTDKSRYLIKPNQKILEPGKSVRVHLAIRMKSCNTLLHDAFESSRSDERTKDKFLVQTLQIDPIFYEAVKSDSSTLHTKLQELWEKAAKERKNFNYIKFRVKFSYPKVRVDPLSIPPTIEGASSVGITTEDESQVFSESEGSHATTSVVTSRSDSRQGAAGVEGGNDSSADIGGQNSTRTGSKDGKEDKSDFTRLAGPTAVFQQPQEPPELRTGISPKSSVATAPSNELKVLRKKYEDAVIHNISQMARIRELENEVSQRSDDIDEGFDAPTDGALRTRGQNGGSHTYEFSRGEMQHETSFGFVHVLLIAMISFLLGRISNTS